MTPHSAKEQAVEEIYQLLRAAAIRKQPVAAIYKGLPRLLCPHVLGRNREGQFRVLCYQFGGSSGSGLSLTTEGIGAWRCLAVEKLSHIELRVGEWRTEPRASGQKCVEIIDYDVDARLGDRPQNGQ